MPRKTRAIGEIPPGPAAPTLIALKEVVEWLSGRRDNRIEKLTASSSSEQITAKINEIIDRLDSA